MTDRPARRLFHHDGSPAAEEHLESLTTGFASGRVLSTYRAWPSPTFIAWFVGPALVVAVFAVIVSPKPWIALVPLGLGFGVASVFVVAGYLDRHRICEHALVLGHRGDQIIPFETIDPGRVYDTRGLFLGRHIEIPTMAVHGSTGPLLLINGLRRQMFSANIAGAPKSETSPFGYYTVGTRKQQEFLAELERAMVADGFTEVAGLTQSTFDLRSVRPQYAQSGVQLVLDRGRHDPPLGVSAPAP